MKINYKKPLSEPVPIVPASMLASSDYTGSGSADGVTFEGESDFDSFFGA